MLDFESMIKSLEEMANQPNGMISIPKTLGMSVSQQNKLHNIELLTDAGLAVWVNDTRVRITLEGHTVLAAVNQDRPRYVDMVKELIGKGKPLLAATSNVISIVNGISATGGAAV